MAANRMLVTLAVAATGCAEPDIVHCADGRVCALGTICVAGGCAEPGCGDNDVDAFFGEQCDDGNLTAGDGCSQTCQFELCGNGILDPLSGEQCDDGNLLSHDGCSSQCLREIATWHRIGTAGGPPVVDGAASTWDPDRGRGMFHGGSENSVTIAEVWTFDGTWHREPPGPPALKGHRMASDGAGSILLFGGDPNHTDCWVWNGTWTSCTGPLPPGRSYHGMGSVSGRGIVVYGGLTQVMDLRTWAWSVGGGWTDAGIAGPNLPFASIASDPVRSTTFLVGVDGPTGSAPTFTLHPTGWTSIGSELPRYAPAMVYDADRRRIIAYAGEEYGGMFLNDLRELQVDRWIAIPADPRPPERRNAVAFHDSIRRGLIVFGGSGFGPDNATWIMRWESTTPDELCADTTTDADGDSLAGCADPDCWGRCDPRCQPGRMDCEPARPRCGDAVCNPWLETSGLCPKDCP